MDESLHNQFEGPFVNKNIKGHIWKLSKNTPLEKAMRIAMSKPECGAFILTDDNSACFKTIDYETAIAQVNKDDVTKGHISYIKKLQ
jgi:hypothetical protein